MKFERIVLVLFVTVCTAIMFLNEYADSGFEEYGAIEVTYKFVDSDGNSVGQYPPPGEDPIVDGVHGHWADHSEEWHSGSCFGSSLLHTDHESTVLIEDTQERERVLLVW